MIEFRNVHFQYEGEDAPALQGIDLVVPDGSFLAIVGHNGSGKSTLSKHINGLLLPTEGQVLVDGLDTKEERTCSPFGSRWVWCSKTRITSWSPPSSRRM